MTPFTFSASTVVLASRYPGLVIVMLSGSLTSLSLAKPSELVVVVSAVSPYGTAKVTVAPLTAWPVAPLTTLTRTYRVSVFCPCVAWGARDTASRVAKINHLVLPILTSKG